MLSYVAIPVVTEFNQALAITELFRD